MKSTSRIVAMALTCTCIATAAFAGAKGAGPTVFIDDVNKIARGTLSAARNSVDSVQMINCSIGASATNNATAVGCMARDAAGVTRVCNTQSAVIVSIAVSIQADSLVEFRWDANGKCTYLQVTQHSAFDPKSLAPVEKRSAN